MIRGFLPLLSLCFSVSLILSAGPSKNYSEINDRSVNTETQYFNAPSYGHQILPVEAEKTFGNEEQIFEFSSPVEIDSVDIEGNTELIEFFQNDELVISCRLRGFVNNSEVSLVFYCGGQLIDRCVLYFARSADGNFHSSCLSLDTAKRAAGYDLGYNLVSEIAVEENSHSNAISPYGIGATGTIYGTLKWKDADGNAYPLAGARVTATMSMSWWNVETYTDASGFYKIDYSDVWHLFGGIPMIHIYTENANVKVTNGGVYEKTYEFDSSSGGEFSYTFSPDKDGDLGKAIMIFQGAKNFADYANYLNGGALVEPCSFVYPSSNLEQGTFYNNNVVYIVNEPPVDPLLFPKSYAAWDVIGHEYGHHIQRIFGLSASPGGAHSLNRNAIDEQYGDYDNVAEPLCSLSDAKSRGQRLSWGEGWATYWSIAAQSSFPQAVKKIKTVGDTAYISSGGVNIDLDYYLGNKGDADEISIQQFLFKLASYKTDYYDRFALGNLEIWNICISNKPTTFSEFVQCLYDRGYDKHDLGALMAKFNIVPAVLSISDNLYYDKLPTITWPTYMGSNNLQFNEFDLYFVDINESPIFSMKNIRSSRDYASFSIPVSLWQEIYDSPGDRFGVYLVSRQTYSYVSGNYYTDVTFFSKPKRFSDGKIEIEPSEWGFQERYYFPGEISDISSPEDDPDHIRFSSLTKDVLTISTDRLRCGYIEDLYVNLSPRRIDAGYAYFEMNFDKPIYSILYCIGLWSNSELLDLSAKLQVKSPGGNWEFLANLFNWNLQTKEQGFNRYSNYFPNGINGIRFECNATADGNKNKGRLSIDDIVLGTKPGANENSYYITNYD